MCGQKRRTVIMSLVFHEKEYVTWVTGIKAVLCNNGFEQVWLFGCGQEGPSLRNSGKNSTVPFVMVG